MDSEHSAIPGQVARGAGAAPPRRESISGPEALTTPLRATLGAAVLVVGLAVALFVGALFLTVAPRNAISAQHASTIRNVVEPEFAQRWQVFAPDPLWANLQLEVRARLTGRPGTKREVTDWFNFSAGDAAGVRSNPIPARRQVNELRNAWSWYWITHDAKGKAVDRQGVIAERYVLRLALGRLDGEEVEGTIQQIQVRVLSRMITPPAWTEETVDSRPDIRTLAWWNVSAADRPAGASRHLSIAGS